MAKKKVYKARENFILFHRYDGKSWGKIAMPDVAEEGMVLVVEAVGPDVKDGLKKGDKILVLGGEGTYTRLPREATLHITRASNVALIIENEDE